MLLAEFSVLRDMNNRYAPCHVQVIERLVTKDGLVICSTEAGIRHPDDYKLVAVHLNCATGSFPSPFLPRWDGRHITGIAIRYCRTVVASSVTRCWGVASDIRLWERIELYSDGYGLALFVELSVWAAGVVG